MSVRSCSRHCLLTTLYLFTLFPAGVIAQKQVLPSFAHYEVIHYDDENGLRSNDVTSFAEDINGHYWFSTQFGLVRFDGKDCRHFYTGNIPTLRSNRIALISRDAKNNLLFRDETRGVHVIQPDGKILPMADSVVRDNILLSRHGFVLDMQHNVKVKKDSSGTKTKGPGSSCYEETHEFYPDANGGVWFLSRNEISYFKDDSCRLVDSYNAEMNRHFFIKNALFVVDAAGRGKAYQEGEEKSITFSMQRILQGFNETGHFEIRYARFFSNQTGTFLQYHNKLYALEFDGQATDLYLLLQNLSFPLAKEVYYSKRHHLYIVITGTDGFYIIREQPFTVRRFGDGMDNSFTAAIEIWPEEVLTGKGVLFTKDSVKKMFPYPISTSTLLKDGKQQIWYVNGDTLFCTNSRLQVLKRWFVQDFYAKSILEDTRGTVWYCAHNSLARIDSGRMRFVYSGYKEFGFAQCMFFLNDTCIWLGATRGLFVFNKKNNTITPIKEMAGKYVRHIYRAKDGSIWIGTYGQGFYTYRNGRFIKLPGDRMDCLSSAHCFMEDDKGFFWIPSNKGLFQVKKTALETWIENNNQQVYYHYYDKHDGFASNEFNGGCSPVGIRLQDGTFSLPSMKGLVWFNPMDMRPTFPVNAIQIDRIMAGTQQVTPARELKFEAGSRKISFFISSPFYGNMANFNPEYRIAGLDNDWAPVGANNSIVINYLKPGSYKLEVRLRRGFEINDYTSKEQLFYVAPYYYETLPFWIFIFLLALLAIIAIVYLYMLRRTRKAKERTLLLERQVTERTQELNTANQKQQLIIADLKVSEDNLHQSNLLKDKLTSVILHDIRSPLRFMNMLSNQLHTALSSGNNRPLMLLTNELRKSTDQLDAFTREFLVWLTTQQAEFKIRNEHIHIQEMFREAEGFYRNILGPNNNILQVKTGVDISVWTDKQLLRIILHNLIDNANKHTENGTIWLSAFLEGEDHLAIQVVDSGEGMTHTELQVLQNRLEEEKNLFVTDGAGNLGYRIIRDFVTKLRGRIQVESVLNTGTTVTVIIPVL